MDQAVRDVLDEYAQRAASEREKIESMSRGGGGASGQSFTIDDLLLWVGPDTGRLLNTLIKGARSKRLLELGTSYGYSTVWLAEAARATGGRVVSCDVSATKQAYARERLDRAGLGDVVELRTGNALETIPTLEDGIDFVLVDLWKDLYVPCLERFLPKLAPGAIVAADNMLQPVQAKADALAYRRAVRKAPGMSSVLLSVGSGIELSPLAGPLDAEL